MRTPGRSLHEDLNMLVEVIDSFLCDDDRFDVLSLTFADHVEDILGRVFGDRKDGPMSDWG